MKQSYSLVAITIANCVSAAWPYSGGDGPLAAAAGISPCWKQCARNEGLSCSMTDISCLCRAANAGLIARANSCACNSCATGYNRSRKRDASSLRLGTLQAMCFAARRPLDQRVINAANSAAECGNGNTDDYAPSPPSYPPAPAPVAIPEEAPSPAYYAPPPPPPPPPIAAPASYSPSLPGSASDSVQDSAYPKSPKNSYDESNPNALSKPDHTVIVPMVSEVESTTTVAFATLTVSVVPMPATGTTTPPPNASSASKTTSTAANGSKTTSTKTTSTKSSQSTGGALKKEAAWAGSMLGLVAAVAFGVA